MSTIPWTHEGSSGLRCSGDESSGNREVGGRSKATLQHFFLCFSAHLLAARASDRQGGKGGRRKGHRCPWMIKQQSWMTKQLSWMINNALWMVKLAFRWMIQQLDVFFFPNYFLCDKVHKVFGKGSHAREHWKPQWTCQLHEWTYG